MELFFFTFCLLFTSLANKPSSLNESLQDAQTARPVVTMRL